MRVTLKNEGGPQSDAMDVDGDGQVAPLDALRVINELNANLANQAANLSDLVFAQLDADEEK